DADGIASAVTGLPKGLFSTVVSHAIRNDKAIKANILQTFREIQASAKEQDMLVVYYAGHGIIPEDESGNSDFYLALHDLTQLYGRTDQLAEKAMSATEIKTLAQDINAQKQVFLLDACQSAGALEAAAKRGVVEERAIAKLARSTGTFWITASGSTQFATEFEQLGHGVFTYALLEGLKGNADINKDGNLTIRELSVFIEDQVPQLTEQYKGTAQYPSSYSFGNDFPLTVFKK
ncbi:MAG: caspase domain-containing protein, partial [Bacteroidota bacterium]